MQLTSEDNEFLDEVKKSFDPDKIENILKKALEKSAVADSEKNSQRTYDFFR